MDRWKFIEWLQGLKPKIGRKGCYLYLDRLAVHKTAEVREECEKMNVELMLAPFYAPNYNPIEFLFSKLKAVVKKMRLHDMLLNRQRPFEELIPLAVRELKTEEVNNCIRHVYKLYDL